MMNLIRSLIGRRQFLFAAGVASTSALAYKKLDGVVGPVFQTGVANASETAGTAEKKGNYFDSSRYSHLLTPLKIGNVVLKNRMYSTNAVPHYIQGPENFPAEVSRTYAANLAKNGASIVTCRIIQNRDRKTLQGDSAHMLIYDLEDYGVQNYLDQLTEGIHCYGSKAMVPLVAAAPGGFMMGMPAGGAQGAAGGAGAPGAGAAGMPSGAPGGDMLSGEGPEGGMPGEGIFGSLSQTVTSKEDLQKIIEEVVTQTKFFQGHGFDAVCLFNTLTSQMKNRTDEYGGSLANRVRFSMDLYKAIKKACGQDFLIETPMTIIEPSIEPEETSLAYSLDEAVELAKMFEGLVDIMQLRVAGGKANHPTGWNSEKNKPLTLRFAEAMKKSGTKVAIAPNGGFQDLAFNNECIATGKADMIAMGHAFICDWEYGRKAYEGRGEDVTPCIMCNKCHGLSQSGQWYTACSVNPKVGIDFATRLIDTPAVSKKVAVIGGGPAGMKAALVAAERGHKVTLYEKGDTLGGLTRHADYSPYKWPLKDFKDHLAHQIKKAGVEVLLNTEATPEMIKKKGYDTVLVAVGAEPAISKIPGADGKNIWNIVNVYGREKELGQNVVMVGGGEFGVETGIYLANVGHKVTMLTSERQLMKMNRVHYPEQIMDTYQHLKGFSSITGVTTTSISEGKVTYKDAKGSEKSIQADSVVIYAGLKAKKDDALKFCGSAPRFLTVGDCSDEGGDVQRSVRSAFFSASQV
jgi:2,4-dienoyl-CoA reductase-like NADH-dependent reductase (Old Yellow Enzyme family)/thioredoxin reductase